MTRTETQLRAALVHLATTADAPAPQPVTARAPQRRTAWVLAVAGVLVAVVAVAVLTVARVGSDRNAAPPLGPTPTTVPGSTTPTEAPRPSLVAGESPPQYAWFALDPASGCTLAGRVDTPTVQSGYVLLPDRPKAEIDVLLYRAGAFDPTSAMTGTPITVQGTPGWRGPVTDPHTTLTLTSDVWQYRPGAWAVVADRSGLADGASAAELLAVADAVRVADPVGDVPVPFTVDRLPAGLSVDVVYSAPGQDPPAASIGFGDDRPGDPERAQADGGALTVLFDRDLVRPSGAPTLQVDGHPAWLWSTSGTPSAASSGFVPAASRQLVVDYGGSAGYGVFSVDARHLDRYGQDELVALAEATTPVADVTDVGTWVPAASGALR